MSFSLTVLVLALCAILLPITIAGSNLALGLLNFLLVLQALRTRKDGWRMLSALRAEPLIAAVVLYAAVGMIAAVFSDFPVASMHDAYKDMHRFWALSLFVAALAVEPKAPLLPVLGLSFGAMALFGIYQTVFTTDPSWKLVRAHGFVHPVVFGEQMALAALGGVCVLLRPAPRALRIAAGVFTVLAVVALALSQTRMALFAACVGLTLVAVLEPRARRWVLPALFIVAAIGVAWEFLPTNEGRSLISTFTHYNPNNPQQMRWVLWKTAARMFSDHPLLGVGPGGYQRHFTAYHPGLLDNENPWSSAHNLYLHQLAERGLLGAIALLVLCGTLLARAVRAARDHADARALWSAGAVAILLTMSLTETSFHNEQFATLFLLIWAWGTAPLIATRARLD